MKDVVSDAAKWLDSGMRVALAVVVRTWGSSPRPTGSIMAVAEDRSLSGSVSGGCIEGDVASEALEVIECGQCRLVAYHAEDEAARGVGLSCGGSVDIFITAVEKREVDALCRALEKDETFLWGFIVESGDKTKGRGFVVREGQTTGPVPKGLPLMASEAAKTQEGMALGSRISYFAARHEPRRRLIAIGATHISIHLTRLAKMLGYRTVVVDPRSAFATEERFAHVDELNRAWPEEALAGSAINEFTAVCALTHDPKIDVPSLAIALRSDAFYIGSLGKPTTQDQRRESLLKIGFGPDDFARIHGPIGLDLGGRAPEETALAIMAEITQQRYQGTRVLRTRK